MKNIITLIFALACIELSAQISVTASSNATTLAQSLAGNGVSISNATLVGANNAAGSFVANNNTNLGLASGVVLTTGRVSDISKSANAGLYGIGASYDNGKVGDAQLTSLVGVPTYNATSLSFDVIPVGNKLTFRYVFMSEEYPDYVCAEYNDIFAFFVNGAKPAHLGGGNYVNQNIATVPNTNQYVGINTVNSGIPGPYSTPAGCQAYNTSYYRNNMTNPYIVYNGGTVVLTATVDVVPCTHYTFKLAIADAFDELYDSGVFLEAGSFSSNQANVSTVYPVANQTAAYEGCSNARVKFTFNEPYSKNGAFKFQISGAATNGVDYQFIPDSIIVPIGATSAFIDIIPIADNIAEGSENVIISLFSDCSTQAYAQTTVSIRDTQNVRVSASKLELCANESAVLTATGIGSFSWSPVAGLSSSNAAQVTATPASNQVYTVTQTLGNCVSQASVSLQKSNLSVSGNVADVQCNAGGAITINAQDGKPAYSYIWNDGVNSKDRNNLQAGTYQVTVSDAIGCEASAIFTVGGATSINISSQVNDANCHGGMGSISLNVSGGVGNYIYVWSNGAASKDLNNVAAGNYEVTVSDAGGCSASKSFSISEPSMISVSASIKDMECTGSGNDGEIILSVSGGAPSYSFVWNDGATSKDRTGLSAGVYAVSITDSKACSISSSFELLPVSDLQVSTQIVAPSCNGGNNGSASVSVSGGNGNYSFAWSNNISLSASANNLSAGVYSVTIADNKGCSTVEHFSISEPDAIQLLITESNNRCYGESDGAATIVASGGAAPYLFSVELQNNSTPLNRVTGNYTELAAGNYIVIVSDKDNCTVSSNFVIAEAEKDEIEFASQATSCYLDATDDGSIHAVILSPQNAPYQFSIDGNVFSADNSLDNLKAGDYIVTSKNKNGCIVNYQVTIEHAKEISLHLPADTIYAEIGHQTQLKVEVADVKDAVIEWNAAIQPDYLNFTCVSCNEFSPLSTTPFSNEYEIKVYSAENSACYREASIIVVVANEIAMPNVFTPNGDNVNDRIYPIFNNKDMRVKEYRIYNAWGQLVFNNEAEGWDGSFNGQSQPTGSYTYFVSYEKINRKGQRETINKNGVVSLVR